MTYKCASGRPGIDLDHYYPVAGVIIYFINTYNSYSYMPISECLGILCHFVNSSAVHITNII